MDLLKKISSFIYNLEIRQNYSLNASSFLRKRILDFPTTIEIILHQFQEGVCINLTNYMERVKKRVPTPSAFTQARAKVKPAFFRELAQQAYFSYFQSPRLLWKGYTLVGVDGSTLNLPPFEKVKEHFGVFSKTNNGPAKVLGRLIVAYDCLNHYLFGSQLSTLKDNEQDMSIKLLNRERFPAKTIFLFDRGFFSQWYIQKLIEDGRFFCMRISSVGNFVKEFLDSGSSDKIVEWTPCKLDSFTKRDIQPKKLKVRLLRFALPGGGEELLATNLYDTSYKAEDIYQLYGLRWGVEEGIKKCKTRMKIEMFGARTLHGIYQELYAHRLVMNIVSIMGMETQERLENELPESRKYSYIYNWFNAFRLVRKNLYDLLHYKRRDRLLNQIIEQMEVSPVAVVPNRKFSRQTNLKGNRYRHNTYSKQV